MATSSFLATLLITIILYEGEMLKLALENNNPTKSPTQGMSIKDNQTAKPTNPILANSPTTPSTPTNTTTTSMTPSTQTNTTSTSMTPSTPTNTTTTSTKSPTPTNTSTTLDTLSAMMSNLSTELELIKINCSTNPLLPPTTLNTLMEIISNLSTTLELITCPTNTLPSTSPNITNTSSPITPSAILQQKNQPKDDNDHKSLKPSKISTQTTETGGSGFHGPTRFLLISSIVIATQVIGYLTWYNRQHLCGLYRRSKKCLQRKDRDLKGSYKRVPVVVDKQDMEHAQSYIY